MAQLSDDCFAFGGPLLSVEAAEALIAERIPPLGGEEEVPLGRFAAIVAGIQDAALVQTLKRKEDEPGTIMTALATVRGHARRAVTEHPPDLFALLPLVGGDTPHGELTLAAIGAALRRLGEGGRAYLTVRADADLDEAQVIAFAKEHLANFKIPRSVVFVDEFPRNASGKILKRNLT